MRIGLLTLCLALTACGSRNGAISDLKPTSNGHDPEFDRVVAWYNGEPLTWKEVAKRMMEMNLQDAVEKYVWWRVIHDQKRVHGIRNSDGELDKRARAALELIRKKEGAEKLKAQLEAAGLTEKEYLAKVRKGANLREKLTLEKLAVFEYFRHGAADANWVVFTEMEDANVLKEYMELEKDFEKSYLKLIKTNMKGRQQRFRTGWFGKSLHPPQMDPAVVDEVLMLKKGDTTGLIRNKNGMISVFNVVEKIEKQEVAYRDVSDRVLSHILEFGVPDDTLRLYVNQLVKSTRIEYENRNSKGN